MVSLISLHKGFDYEICILITVSVKLLPKAQSIRLIFVVAGILHGAPVLSKPVQFTFRPDFLLIHAVAVRIVQKPVVVVEAIVEAPPILAAPMIPRI